MNKKFFQKKLLETVKSTYSTSNKNLLNLSNIKTFINMGYPEALIKEISAELMFAFPIAYPFKNVCTVNKTVGDFGCGAGIDSYIALKLSASKIISTDLSFSFLKKINSKNVIKINADLNYLPFKNNYFDIIIMNGSLNLVYNKISLLERLNVIIKKNGLLIICDLIWCGYEKERELYKNDINAWCWCTGGCLTDDELTEIAEKYNFKLITKEEYEQIETLKRMRYIFKNE